MVIGIRAADCAMTEVTAVRMLINLKESHRKDKYSSGPRSLASRFHGSRETEHVLSSITVD